MRVREILIVGAVLWALPVRASVLLRMDVEALAARSTVVAVATVREVTSDLDPDGAIRTRARLEVEREIAGPGRAREIVVVTPGGRLAGIVAPFLGGPVFAEGDRVVVFLEPRRAASPEHLVVGGFQGVFRVIEEAETGMPVAVRDAVAPGSVLVGPGGAEIDEIGGERRLYLDEIEARVEAVRRGSR